MTHEERIALLERQPGETISPTVAAQVLGGSPYAYNLTAREGKLNLPHVWRGRNLRILKTPLLKLIRDGVDTAQLLGWGN